MRHTRLETFKLYFEKFTQRFKKKKENNSRLIINNIDRKTYTKKRKNINININFENYLKFFKKNYIPYYFIISIIIITSIIIILFGPFLNIRFIEIIKKDNITNMNIAYKSVEDIRGEKMFNIHEIDIFNKLKNYQNNIKSIDMKMILPNTIKLEIESYKEIFNITLNGNNYILVENGTIIPSNHSKNLKFLNVIKKIDRNKFIEYKQIFNPFFIEKINNIINKLEENIVNIKIKNIDYYEVERELHIQIENDNILIFSLDDDLDYMSQIEKLVVFNKEYSSIIDNKIFYIDLRIKNKIFYCDANMSYQCSQNIKSIYNK
ncbi:MAG: hypothetical protein PHI37_03035 [Candidatus Gracilibacteria bacterium]|nr:hypothetical protein [Candidatus Gracilibacteria bacterium]